MDSKISVHPIPPKQRKSKIVEYIENDWDINVILGKNEDFEKNNLRKYEKIISDEKIIIKDGSNNDICNEYPKKFKYDEYKSGIKG